MASTTQMDSRRALVWCLTQSLARSIVIVASIYKALNDRALACRTL